MKNVANFFYNAAKNLGFNSGTEAEEEDIMAQGSGFFPLAHHLLYRYFCQDSSLFFNEESIGFGFEISQIVGANESIEKNVRLFFESELPKDSYIQFLLIASHDIAHILDQWEQGRTCTSLDLEAQKNLGHLTKARRAFVQKNSTDFSHARDGRLPRNFRSFVTVSMRGLSPEKIEECNAFKQKFEHKLMAENLAPRILDGQDLMQIAREILQPDLYANSPWVPRYDRNNPLNDQITKAFGNNQIRKDGIVHQLDRGNLVSKIFAPTQVPESFSFAQMIKLLGDDRRVIAGRFVISFAVANDLGSKGTAALLTAANRSIHAANQSYTRSDLVAQDDARQWMQVKAAHQKGEIFLQESMLVMLTNFADDIDASAEVLKNIYNGAGWKIEVADYVQRLANLAMLPMMQASYWNSLKFFKLTRLGLSSEVVAKLPIQGEWKGSHGSGMLLQGRCGQLFNFNPFHRVGGGGNFNGVVIAPSGSGKSFALEELAQAMVAQSISMFIMDIGGSYKNLCHLLGGELVQFSSSNQLSLNPFASLSNSGATFARALELLKQGVALEQIIKKTLLTRAEIESLLLGLGNQNFASDIEAIEVITVKAVEREYHVTKDSIIYAKSLIAAMCGVCGRPRQEALLERSIIEGIKQYGSELDLTKVAKVLAQLQDQDGNLIDEARSMADSLYPYSDLGIHGRFFERSSKQANFTKAFTVFELEELRHDKPLLSVVLQVILMQITMQFLCGDRSRQFVLIVDEAWMILDHAAHFLEGFARTVRKYGGSLWVCTQDLSSFANECGTKKAQASILEGATWKFILKQNADGIKAFASNASYAKYAGLIESLHKSSENKFSEILIMSDGLSVVGRLAVDPYSTALFSTESGDFNFLLQQEKLGLSMHEAAIKLAQKYGADGS
jgi:type-IV secretion system protein TraC